jgi:Flp pilus assembly protein TadD
MLTRSKHLDPRPVALFLLCLLACPIAAAALPIQAPAATAAATSENVRYDLMRQAHRVESDGSFTFTQEAQLLLRTATAVAQFGQLLSAYVEGYGTVSFESVVIGKPDGRNIDVRNGPVEDVNPFGATGTSALAGVRFKKLTIPGLEPGDRLSYRIVVHTKAVAPGHIFGQVKFYPLVGEPTQTYELDLPRTPKVRVWLREDLGAGWEEVPAAPDRLVRRLTVKVPALPTDWKTLTKAKLQALAEPDVMFTSFSSWKEVGEWWWALSKDRLEPDAAVKAEAATLVASKTTPREKIEALHRFVSSKIRYVRVSLDIGRQQPRPAAEVLSNRYGDCKDKHALLAALASAVGIDVRPVFVNSVRQDLYDEVPGPQQFDHMISVVRLGPEPADWLWLDGTNPFGVPGYLVPNLRDKRALLIEPSGEGRIVRTPAEPPFVQRQEVELKGALEPDGVLRARAVWRVRTDDEGTLRAAWAVMPQEKQAGVVQVGFARGWKDGTVTNVSASDPLDISTPFRVEFDVERPAPSTPAKGQWNLWIPLPEFELPQPSTEGPDAAEPLDVGRREFTARAEIEIPEGLSVRAPLSISLDRPFGTFASTYSVEGRRLVISRTMKVTQRSIPTGDIPSYEAFRKTIDTDRDQKFQVLGDLAQPGAVTAESLHAEGLAALKSDDNLKAVELLRKATEADPKLKDVFHDLGRALSAAGQDEEALKAFSRQIEITPYHEGAYAWRASVLERLGRRADAEKDLLKQIEVAPFETWSYERLASRRTGEGRFHEAAELYSRAAAIKPKEAERWVDLAWAQARDGQAEEARAALARARALDLRDWLKISAAGVYDRIGDTDAAAELAEDGLTSVARRLAEYTVDDLNESDLWSAEYLARAWYVIGDTALAKGDMAKAERYLDAAWKIWFLPEAGWALGNLREKQGHIDDAADFWGMAVLAPDASWRLPAGWAKRIEKASYQVSGTWASPKPKLAKLTRVPLSGEALANRYTVVLLLEDADGKVEQVRSVSEHGPEIDRQLSALGPIQLPLARPDDRAFKAVRKAYLSCRRGKGCTLALMGGQDDQDLEAMDSVEIVRIDPPDGSTLHRGQSVTVTARFRCHLEEGESASVLLVAQDQAEDSLILPSQRKTVECAAGKPVAGSFVVPQDADRVLVMLMLAPPRGSFQPGTASYPVK